jgi:hypothetical protein
MVATGLLTSMLLMPRMIWHEPYVGFITAFVVVTSAYIVPPSSKLSAATVYFILGSCLAWWMLKDSFYPEIHPKAYQPTLIPLYATISGGIMALGIVTIKQKWLTSQST